MKNIVYYLQLFGLVDWHSQGRLHTVVAQLVADNQVLNQPNQKLEYVNTLFIN